ncbi:hypothetical protein SAICODRAFT_70683 [Saitoella complicata NRRL Y-17804]|nr:uncharacterized protein SAICODRAFT_70683 [Saitoella complicata NRRL Y-17804]ODQ54001.1 hypothetical protein SAICODRAFT_70683 [Saitoella complicata NRRL Y-17804]
MDVDDTPGSPDPSIAAAAGDGTTNETSLIDLVDTSVFIDYLKQLCLVTLGATEFDLETTLLRNTDTETRCARFIGDTSGGNVALYVAKEAVEGDDTKFTYALSTDLSSTPATVASLALIKRAAAVLDASQPLQSQLQIVNLPGLRSPSSSTSGTGPTTATSPYETLHSLIHLAIAPYFDAYAKEGGTEKPSVEATAAPGTSGIPQTKKKIAELELSLLHLQQNVQIPEIQLAIHPTIVAATAAAKNKGVGSGTKASVGDLDPVLVQDPTFLNGLQGSVGGWIKSIQTITKLAHNPTPLTSPTTTRPASSEVSFWLSLETALTNIDAQLRSEGVSLTLEVLRAAKRFHTTVSFIADTGLKEAGEVVARYNLLMREFPLDELLSATSLERVGEAVIAVFGHLCRKLRVSPYPIRRALPLVQAISADFDERIVGLLRAKRVMHLSHPVFETLATQWSSVFRIWDEQYKEFTNVAREVSRKRSEKFIPIKIGARHVKTQERLEYVRAFRKGHEQLRETIGRVIAGAAGVGVGEEGDVESEVVHAYEALRDVDVLDVSPEGTEVWFAAETTYTSRISHVENSIILRLRDRLGTARTASEMFRVFSTFNALFVRPKIRGAIGEYQAQLIENVKRDIQKLHDKFRMGYGGSDERAMAQLRDLPPISGAIVWARQIERQLMAYMGRVEDVLGKGWELYAEGQKLKEESDTFRKKLETRGVYEQWLAEVQGKNLALRGRLFEIVRNRAAGGTLELVVHFDPQVIALFKEVRNLVWLGFAVPHAISHVSKDAKRVYPFAVSLMEGVRTYGQSTQIIGEMGEVRMLLNGYQADVQKLIKAGLWMRWESFVQAFDAHLRPILGGGVEGGVTSTRENKHIQFVQDFGSAVLLLQTKTDMLVRAHVVVVKAVNELRTCKYDAETFQGCFKRVQGAIDQLNLENYVNLEQWVEKLNEEIETVLAERLRDALAVWTKTFVDGVAEEDGTAPVMQKLVHEVTIRNQVIYLDPPVEYARASWFAQLHNWLGVVCKVEKIQASRYEMTAAVSQHKIPVVYANLPLKVAETHLSEAYKAIEKKLGEVSAYVDKWLQFQSLWDLQSEHVYAVLGDDLGKWLQILGEIRKSRATFDTSDVYRSFGHITVDYEQVQGKVNAKYDAWQRDIIQKFAAKLGNRMRDFLVEISQSRNDLEQQSLDSSSTAQAVSFITVVQKCTRKVIVWAPEVEMFQKGQTTLSRQRFQFPNDWLYVDQIEGEWSALNEILRRKTKLVTDQLGALQAKVVAEHKVVAQKISETVADWEARKPVSGSINPVEATQILAFFSMKLGQLKQDYDMVARAKEALNLDLSGSNPVDSILEEVQDFKSVWAALSTIWSSLQDLKDTQWSAVVPRKVRQTLDNLLNMTKEMPSRMRQYAAFEYVQDVLRKLIKINPLLTDLSSEAMRERHWQSLLKGLRASGRIHLQSMTLGTVWDLDLTTNEKVVRDVLLQAQGEMALEEFLNQVRETWSGYPLELVNYQNKCRLIKGWDDLFAKCSENLNSLTAMRHSSYYRVFEEEAAAWEDKLNRVHVLFDVWIDVQRQWVYLEGIFTGNADIKNLLPMESSRFQNINAEFMSLMKKVYKSPFVMDVLNIPGVQKSLERLADLLSKIQKALGEYLERERSAFPRFYFLGDEDLLEIIGNSRDATRIQKHFKKMFAGINGLIFNDDTTLIQGFTSSEGEEVRLAEEISLVKLAKINEWLSALERNMKLTLAGLLGSAVNGYQERFMSNDLSEENMLSWLAQYPAQLSTLAAQVTWTSAVEETLARTERGDDSSPLEDVVGQVERVLGLLASAVLKDLDLITRKKCEHLITELVHQRDVVAKLDANSVTTPTDFRWLYQMRFHYKTEGDILQRLKVKMANAVFEYGYEYLGVGDRLVQTPLTDRCYLTLTQALSQRLGGSPYGPAGTGKTESVKALGTQLGRFVLVFNCDDTFDFQAMGRIFLGLCQVGAWGCFDEFNRLEERILSAVSQQIQSIQLGLKALEETSQTTIELIGKTCKIHEDTGIFITMNPGYAGRSNLPDNLKKLFRSIAMTKPDKELIAQVMLYSQGFAEAKQLATQIVPFFELCDAKLSAQSHYDFGLRALKSVLVTSGNLKRTRIQSGQDIGSNAWEAEVVLQSLRETIAPKLVGRDNAILTDIEADAFPGVRYVPADLGKLEAEIRAVAAEKHLITDELWLQKTLQLYQIQSIHHGLMLVGQSGSGKSRSWRVLLEALQRLEGVEGVSHVIDAKVMSKEALYGNLDSTTREWTDGLFTGVLRKIVDNLRGEDTKRHWIVFDGDVDPEWVENLNSVLDDNRLLTLPNGERLNLPGNVRIIFEVETLKYATLATVSRCGMVWFSEDVVRPDMMIQNYLQSLQTTVFDDLDEDSPMASGASDSFAVQKFASITFTPLMEGIALKALEHARSLAHIMDFTTARALSTLFSLMNKACRDVLVYNAQHPDFPLEEEPMERFLSKKLMLNLVWSFSGDCKLDVRQEFGAKLAEWTTVEFPPLEPGGSLIDWDVSLPTAEWVAWQQRVPTTEIATHSVTQADVVVPTVDTVRHEDILYSWLAEHKPLMLCGPPGSGKTMTLFGALRKLPNLEVAGLNFSSATTPDLVVKVLEQYCEYRKTLNGTIMAPTQVGRWLVIFCDEINLPAPDKYGTQRVISFLRQLVEHNGFWRTSDKTWVTLERVQFVGACNPPTDVGRTPLTARFLRHAPLIMVDYPGRASMMQIYGTFNRAVLKCVPSLRGYADALTSAMVDLYVQSQDKFTADVQAHYIYSPRELTRWVRAIFEALRPLESLDVEGLVRIWAHEALRLFSDRLVLEKERTWTEITVREIALQNFPGINEVAALKGPILYSNWLSRNYVPVAREELREFTKARLRTFCEEEVDVPLVLFNDVLDHVLRIDRVFRQPQGHMILIGVSGSGKTTLARFVAWMNGLKVFQIKVHGRYSSEDFDEDLRDVLRRAGCKGEKVCFIMDESNVLDSGFLERMNTLLANAEVPGLFEGDDYAALMTNCREGAQREGLLLDSPEELYKWFTQQIVKNLHVVFTMNPPEGGLSSKAATSPALFNRCVLNWMGDWSDQAFYQVALESTQGLDLDDTSYVSPQEMQIAYRGLSVTPTHREAIINAMVYIHMSVHEVNRKLAASQSKTIHLTPRHYLDFVNQFVRLFNEKRAELEEEQRHLNVGLDKLQDTFTKVEELRGSLAEKRVRLEQMNAQANEKLQSMVADQQEAEQKRAASLVIQQALAVQEKEIDERREIVIRDLERAEPAVLEAQRSVQNIKKQHLTEVRSMANPPEAVKTAMESVCVLLSNKVDTWRSVQSVIRRDDFIPSIVNFDNAESMTPQLRAKMEREFLSRPGYDFESVNRASKACGPLVQWVIAQCDYSIILEKVGPLREEVDQLEYEAESTKAKAETIIEMIDELEASIAQYKEEYAALISETQLIKQEMQTVESKVNRSATLLESLSSEKERWESGSHGFKDQMSTLIGDVLLAAAFLAYGGFYDEQYRRNLYDNWGDHLLQANIKFKEHNPITNYLCTADERLEWQGQGLSNDDLSVENAIILKRFNRYPLIIDPTGRVTDFLNNQFITRKLTVTSFLDAAFVKHLESALRFGNPILIQDAEHVDPILNHVLNKEYQKAGGRVLIQLGKQDIDFSPSFKVFLSTRDPSAHFAPDVCSRVTFVNFTVTRSSLQTQCLNKVLQVERPDIEKRRTDLLKLKGEFAVNLRSLEKRLLQALNDSRGNILDDDKVIETLQTLKSEAAVIAAKVAETDGVMAEVEEIAAVYEPLARTCSMIFAVLEQLGHVNRFYQFSLKFFQEVFGYVLSNTDRIKGITDPRQRVEHLQREVYLSTFARTSQGLLHQDHAALALLLAQLSSSGFRADAIDWVLNPALSGAGADNAVEDSLGKAASLPLFRQIKELIAEHKDEWQAFLTHEQGEKEVPKVWSESQGESDDLLHKLLLVRIFRPDRVVPATEQFVNAVFNTELANYTQYDLKNIVSKEVDASIPIALCSIPGYDASSKVEAVISQVNARCTSVALGSAEGLTSADTAITSAAQTGTWVLLKNVHMAPQWLGQLEKRLLGLKAHPNFRLFMTMETSPKVPTSILRLARVLMFEPPPGMKANIRESLATITPDSSLPAERARLAFVLSWLHATITERLRYTPLGWTKAYEFNDADLKCAVHVVDTWIRLAAGGRSNIAPDRIPWRAIVTLVVETIYGGKIDEVVDEVRLQELVGRLFTPKVYDLDFPLVGGDVSVTIPDANRLEQFQAWVEKLPEREPPTWFGLPEDAEKVLLREQGVRMVESVRNVGRLMDENMG